MLFSSMIFLWIFIILLIGIYYSFNIIPFKNNKNRTKAKNITLLIFSLIFYAWGGFYYVFIMISSIILNFFGGYLLSEKVANPKRRKALFIAVIVANVGILFFFKYFNMLVVVIESFMQIGDGILKVFNGLLTMEGTGALGLKEIVLPIGISFFTFQSLSYVIDVYQKKVGVQKNIFDFALYVSLFPQLIAGPIVKYSDIDLQLHDRTETLDSFTYGIRRFSYGLGKKVIISNTFAEVADSIWALETNSLGSLVAWFGIIAYAIQIYFDFSGYSDMAIGLGKIFGFTFKENFNYPYTSLSVQEFWRRWHISLSTWFREYIYIPLGGNRKGKKRTYLNLFIVFLLTGIWHGANFTFIFWGIYYAIFLIIERLFLGDLLNKNRFKFFNWIYMFLVILIGWVFFRAENIMQAFEYLKQMFSFGGSQHSITTYLSTEILLMLIIGVGLAGFVQRKIIIRYKTINNNRFVIVADFVFQMLIVIFCIMALIGGTYNPFIYFQF